MYKNEFLYELIKSLRKKFIIGVLSDQWYLSRDVLIPKSDNKYFDFVIISYEVKMRKPDPEIYKLLLRKVRHFDKKIKPSEILFIDNRVYNLEPARKLCIKTILFEDNKQFVEELSKYNLKYFSYIK